MSNQIEKASKEEVFIHLISILDEEAITVACVSAKKFKAGERAEGYKILADYDARIGNIYLRDFLDKKGMGVYRPLSYVSMYLSSTDIPEEFTRYMVIACGSYLEALLKKMVRLGFIEKIKDNLPLGALVYKARKKLSQELFDNLNWFSQRVYNHSKHTNSFESYEVGDVPEHYFDLDEAIAIYLIARKLGQQLEFVSGKTMKDLEKE